MDLLLYLLVGLPLNLLFLYIIFDVLNGDNKLQKNMEKSEIKTQEIDESTTCDYGKRFICPNCGEPFDGHECENCYYTEDR